MTDPLIDEASAAPYVSDRLTALKILKGDSATRAIPVVMSTTLSQIDDRLPALEDGVRDFIVKPCHPRELIARIDQQRRWRAGKSRFTFTNDDVSTEVRIWEEAFARGDVPDGRRALRKC